MDERWALLVGGARTMMDERQQATYEQFGLDDSMQYEWSLDCAEFVFSSRGTPIVRADLQYVGTIDSNGRWLWGWADKTIPAIATKRLAEIRTYGEEQRFPKLTDAEWQTDGDDGHNVMIVSACILGAPAVFHYDYENAALFFALDGFESISSARG